MDCGTWSPMEGEKDCVCYAAVLRTYDQMRAVGRGEAHALRVATRVLAIHHPELDEIKARDTVMYWTASRSGPVGFN